MYTHYIEEVKKMTPRKGQSFSTTYYNASHTETTNLLKMIKNIHTQMVNDLNNEYEATQHFYIKELGKRHKKKDKSIYIVAEVIDDLFEQLKAGKSATKSMIDRWNIAFNDEEDLQIDIVVGTRIEHNIPNHLFDFG